MNDGREKEAESMQEPPPVGAEEDEEEIFKGILRRHGEALRRLAKL